MRRLFLAAVLAVSLFSLTLGISFAGAKDTFKEKEYVGSAACKKCHAKDYESWDKETKHGKIVMEKKKGLLKAAAEKWATDGTDAGPATGNIDGKPYKLDDVVYVVGSYWKQRYLVKEPATDGHQFLNKQFNRISGKWEPYGQKNTWETMCGTCHTTGYRILSYDPAKPQEMKVAFSEFGIGCEACHGPGAKHVKSRSKKDIYNPAGQPKDVQARLCGYCHIRLENERYKSAQGNNSEHLPAPKVGDSFKPSDDWTKWYPEHVVIPGVQPDDPIDKQYTGDLKGMFKAYTSVNKVFYVEGKHHQEYQGFIQSKHYKNGMGCMDCHSAHATKKAAKKDPKASCAKCHDASYTAEKYMPGTAGTAKGLFVSTHTFAPVPPKGGQRVTGQPEYYH